MSVLILLLPKSGPAYNVDHVSNFMAITDMVGIVSEAFQCLNVFNIDIQNVYVQVFDLLCLQRQVFDGGGWVLWRN